MKRIAALLIAIAPAAVLTPCAPCQADPTTPAATPSGNVAIGRTLFLKNCAHCHGADARGDEGPDLHKLDWSDQQIAARIRNGKKGQMTAFGDKLQPAEYRSLILYLRTLK